MKDRLAKLLSVSDRTVRDWTSRIDKDDAEERKKQMFDLWLACHTQQEIADAMGVAKQTLNDSLSGFGNLASLGQTDQNAATHSDGFKPPIYNIWKQQEKTSGSSHFGNSEIQWLDLFEQVPI